MRKWILAMVAAAVVGGAALQTQGMFMNAMVEVPIDRVITNMENRIKANPQDAQLEYILGRIHAMAYAYGAPLKLWQLPGRGGGRGARRGASAGGEGGAAGGEDPLGGQLPGFAPYDTVRVTRRENAKDYTAEDVKHLQESIKHYKRAIELDAKNALYEMGLAWMYEEAGKAAKFLPAGFDVAVMEKPTPTEEAAYDAAIRKLGDADPKAREDATRALTAALPKSYGKLLAVKADDAEISARAASILKGYWDLQALARYRKAYELAVQADLASRGGLHTPDLYVSAESGDRILEILKSQPGAAKENETRDVAANVKRVRDKPMAITPVIFAMPGVNAGRVGDLLDTSKRVKFDLAGDGVKREWLWLKDGAAVLVWDPALTGNITNGRQLFGGRTWWVFFRDGYEALSVLDDNGDGRLAGAEMQGVAVWIDRNGDAVSQPGEVVSLERAGISSIGVKASKDKDGTLVSERGVTFFSGETVKTFDWVTEPLSPNRSMSQDASR